MKRLIMILLATLLLKTSATSQVISSGIGKDSTVLLTPKQLKETNLIFAEHNKLLTENTLLYKQINNYKKDNELLINMDSARVLQLNNYETLSKSYQDQVATLNKQIKKKKTSSLILKIACVGLLLFAIFK